MLVLCDHRCIDKNVIDRFVIFNLSSLLEGFERVNILPPFKLDRNDREFDIMYANYIIENDAIFYEFMKIMMSLYYGLDTLILVDKQEHNEYVNESLIKFIQQRYGYICNSINVNEDWEYVQESEFSIQGLYNIDKDKERFAYIHVVQRGEKID